MVFTTELVAYNNNWGQLTTVQQHCALAMGYNKPAWDHGNRASHALDNSYWKDMSTSQKQGALCLGYTPSSWDNAVN